MSQNFEIQSCQCYGVEWIKPIFTDTIYLTQLFSRHCTSNTTLGPAMILIFIGNSDADNIGDVILVQSYSKTAVRLLY